MVFSTAATAPPFCSGRCVLEHSVDAQRPYGRAVCVILSFRPPAVYKDEDEKEEDGEEIPTTTHLRNRKLRAHRTHAPARTRRVF